MEEIEVTYGDASIFDTAVMVSNQRQIQLKEVVQTTEALEVTRYPSDFVYKNSWYGKFTSPDKFNIFEKIFVDHSHFSGIFFITDKSDSTYYFTGEGELQWKTS